MDKEVIFLVEESPEGGYEAHALVYSIYTQADSLEELRRMVQDAIQCHFENGQEYRLFRLCFLRSKEVH